MVIGFGFWINQAFILLRMFNKCHGLQESSAMYKFQVEGISCNQCVVTITDAIRQLDEQAKVEVRIDTQQVMVNSTLPPHVIERAIVDAGYPVREMAY